MRRPMNLYYVLEVYYIIRKGDRRATCKVVITKTREAFSQVLKVRKKQHEDEREVSRLLEDLEEDIDRCDRSISRRLKLTDFDCLQNGVSLISILVYSITLDLCRITILGI